MFKSERIKISAALYLNYFVHGMAIVILAQNMSFLADQWNSNYAGVSYVISSLGIGRLIVLYLAGILSDKYGRKIFVVIGILTYIPFFIGEILSTNIYAAYFFGVLAGMANSFLDSGTYPALMEMFPGAEASVNIFIKVFASFGELSLPILVNILDKCNLWFGWSFIFCSGVFVISLSVISRKKFPIECENHKKIQRKETKTKISKIKLFEGAILTFYGYISMSTFYLISQWLTQYGESVVKLSLTNSRILVSLYSVGSILGALINAAVINKFLKDENAILIYTCCSFIVLLLMSTIINEYVMVIGSFAIGFSAAGGVMQIGLTIMSRLFPRHKGKVTGIYYTASSISSFTIPIFTGMISMYSIHLIMWFDVLISFLGVMCAIIISCVSHINYFKEKELKES